MQKWYEVKVKILFVTRINFIWIHVWILDNSSCKHDMKLDRKTTQIWWLQT
jgi:hypothetical protein